MADIPTRIRLPTYRDCVGVTSTSYRTRIVLLAEIVVGSVHEYTASGKSGVNRYVTETLMHFGEPSAHVPIEAAHVATVQNAEAPL